MSGAKKRKYKSSWENEDDFRGWLCAKVKNEDKEEYAFCRICKEFMIPHKTNIKRHTESRKHKKNETKLEKRSTIVSSVEQSKDQKTEEIKVDVFTTNMEINNKIQYRDLKFKCRVCLQISEHMMSIFTKVDGEILSKKISDCGDIKIEENRNNNFYPEKICPECFASVNIAHKFRKMCKNSDNILHSLLSKLENELNISNAMTENYDLDEEICCVDEINRNNIQQIEIKQEVDNNEMYYEEDIDADEYLIQNNEHEISDEIITKSEKCAKMNEIVSKPSKNQTKKKDSTNSLEKYIKINNGPKEEPKDQSISMNENDHTSIKNSNDFICEMCGNKYKKKSLLKNHLLWHNNEKPCKCEVCGKGFTVISELKRHMRVHTGDKPYNCNYCDRKFADYSTCARHKRTHTNERPYKCNICEKSFTYACVLKVHMAIHTGDKRFTCDQCGKGFYQKHKLNAHFATLFYQNGCKTPTNNKKSK